MKFCKAPAIFENDFTDSKQRKFSSVFFCEKRPFQFPPTTKQIDRAVLRAAQSQPRFFRSKAADPELCFPKSENDRCTFDFLLETTVPPPLDIPSTE